MGQSGKTSRALVISDDEKTRQISAILIEESGFQVMEAATIEQADPILERHAEKLDLVFADACSGRDARDLAQRIASTWPWIRVLVSLDNSVDAGAAWPTNSSTLKQPWYPLDLLIEAERALN